MKIFDAIVSQHFDKKLSQPNKVELEVFFYSDEQHLSFLFYGYNDKMSTVIELALQELKNAIDEIDEEQFNYKLKDIKKELHNATMDNNYFGSDELAKILKNRHHTGYELVKSMDELNFEEFKEIIAGLFKKLKIMILAQGNFTKEQTMEVVEILRTHFECDSYSDVRKYLKMLSN